MESVDTHYEFRKNIDDLAAESAGYTDDTVFLEDPETGYNSNTSTQKIFVDTEEVEYEANNVLFGEPAQASEPEDTIEIPRGFGAEDVSVHQCLDPEISASVSKEQGGNDNDVTKVLEFLKNLTEQPAWARSISYVKLNATVPKDIQVQLIDHAFINVNARPRCMTILTKSLDAKDLTNYEAFESHEAPLQKSLFRLYCKNPVTGLRPLLRAVLLASSLVPSIEVEYSDVLGEVIHKGTKIRMKTSDLKTFCKVEEKGRALNMRFLTTFECRSNANRNRNLQIRYYDEVKADRTRVVYVHLDHEVDDGRGIKIGGVSSITPFDIDKEEMVPLAQMYPKIYDLVDFIVKYSPSP